MLPAAIIEPARPFDECLPATLLNDAADVKIPPPIQGGHSSVLRIKRFLLFFGPMAQEKRVALVTGGAVRVGRAIVEKLAVEGFSVAFTYRSSESEANELATRVAGKAIRADLADPETASLQVHASFLTFADRLDLLVNSASAY